MAVDRTARDRRNKRSGTESKSVGTAAEGKQVEREGATANQSTILGSAFQDEGDEKSFCWEG
jgi:hypothetical protein